MSNNKNWKILHQKKDLKKSLIFDEIGEKYRPENKGSRPVVVTNQIFSIYNQYTKLRKVRKNSFQKQEDSEIILSGKEDFNSKDIESKDILLDENKLVLYQSYVDTNQFFIATNEYFNSLIDYDVSYDRPNLNNEEIEEFISKIKDYMIDTSPPNISVVMVYDNAKNQGVGVSLYLSDEKIEILKRKTFFDRREKKLVNYYDSKVNWNNFKSSPNLDNIKSFSRYKTGIFVCLNTLESFAKNKLIKEDFIDDFFISQKLNKNLWKEKKIILPLQENKKIFINSDIYKPINKNSLNPNKFKNNEKEK